jgi:hypothetical protein
MQSAGEPEPLIYREEVLGITGALASVRLLRELAAKGWADLEARRLAAEREAREA